jgi:hypothetical protein
MHYGQSKTAANSTYPKGGVSCFIDSFMVNQIFIFKSSFVAKSPALRIAKKPD